MAANFAKCSQLLRIIKRRVPAKEAALNIPAAIVTELAAHVITMGRVVRALSELHKQTRQAVLMQGGKLLQETARKKCRNEKLSPMFPQCSKIKGFLI